MDVTRLAAMAGLAALGTLALAAPAWAKVDLPFDPTEATRQWLATMGPAATARSNTFFEGNYWLNAGQQVFAILVAGALLYLGWIRGAARWLERTVKLYPLVVLGTAVVYLLIASVITLPVDFYVSFIRLHQFHLSNQTPVAWLTDEALNSAVTIIGG